MTLDDALAVTPVPGIYLDVEAMCVSIGGPIDDALNALSLDLARRYVDGKVTYTVADAVINNFWGYYTKWIFASLPPRSVPEPMFSVFLAFESGEFYPDDIRDPSPEERFTRPRIAAILSQQIAEPGRAR